MQFMAVQVNSPSNVHFITLDDLNVATLFAGLIGDDELNHLVEQLTRLSVGEIIKYRDCQWRRIR